MKNRREFLKDSTFSCAALMLGAMGVASLDACKAKAVAANTSPAVLTVVDNTVKMAVADMNDVNAKVVDISNGQKLLVNKNADGTYTAFEYKCPHEGGPLEKIGDVLVCPWHDSRFGLDGSLQKGPARTGLKTFPAKVEGKEIVIKLA